MVYFIIFKSLPFVRNSPVEKKNQIVFTEETAPGG